jgi:hypothetical protein
MATGYTLGDFWGIAFDAYNQPEEESVIPIPEGIPFWDMPEHRELVTLVLLFQTYLDKETRIYWGTPAEMSRRP